jgi:polyadenylate-binding protein
MNGKIIANKPIYVALAQRKEQRRAQLEAQYAAKANGIRLQQQAQASGMSGSPLYATGAPGPVFYAQPVVGRPNFVYPGTGMPAPRFPAFPGGPQPRAPYQAVPYRVGPPQGGRGQPKGRNPKGMQSGGGRGGPQGYQNYPGIKYNANVRNPQQPSANQAPAQAPEDNLSPEERKQVLGESLYPLIAASLKAQNKDEELAGKITGMLLEGLEHAELVAMIESPDVLSKKLSEALDVLNAHAPKSE